jgi:hypothetical protein
VTAALQKLKKWFTRKATPRPAPASLGPPPALLERYLQYKRLLAANSAVLTIVADLQVKMDEGFLFDMYYVRQACDRLRQEVEAMVSALNAMAADRYRALETARQRVTQLVAEELAGPILKPVPLAIPLREVREGFFCGGKAEKLGELTRLGLQVPAGFGISAYAQKLLFETANLEEFIGEAIAHSHIRDLESLREAGEVIRQKIMAQPLPAELSRAIQEQLEGLAASRVAVRSSALQEDSFFSFAGQFESVLNVPRDQVERRYKEVIASQFTPGLCTTAIPAAFPTRNWPWEFWSWRWWLPKPQGCSIPTTPGAARASSSTPSVGWGLWRLAGWWSRTFTGWRLAGSALCKLAIRLTCTLLPRKAGLWM